MLGVCALARAEAPPTLLVDDATAPVLVGRHLEILRDDSGGMTLEQARDSTAWVPSQKDIPNPGTTTTPYWYRLRLQREPGLPPGNFVLELAYPQLDTIDLHLLRRDGSGSTFLSGDTRHTAPGQIPAPTFAFPLGLDGATPTDLYLRLRTEGRHEVALRLWSANAFERHAVLMALWDGLVYGVLVVMIFYNTLIWSWTRDRAYGQYVAYLSLMTLAIFIATGYARQLGNDLFPSAPALINRGFPYLWNIVLLASVLFAREFLQTRDQAPRAHRGMNVLACTCIAAVGAQPFVTYAVGANLGYVNAALTSIAMLGTAAILAARGHRQARFYLLSWLVLLCAILLNVLDAFGVLPLGAFSTHTVKAGIALDITILSLALADRINAERREKLAARELALEQSQRLGHLRQFLPARVADLVASGDGALLNPKRRNVAVLVIDLRGFTPFSEKTPPDEVMSVLREFYDAMGRITHRHGGTVEHFAGDSILVMYNAPLEIEEPVRQALVTALEMRETFERLRAGWTRRGHELGLGIGVSEGEATIGAIGFSDRSQYAAIGAVTNLAARLCSLAKHGEILASERAVRSAGPSVIAESVGEQPIKGFSKPVAVMRVTALA